MKFSLQGLLFVAAMLGLLAASYFLVLSKASEHRAQLEQEIQAKQRALADLDRTTAGIDDVKGKIAELEQAVTFFESKLPQAQEIDKILKEVWQMAEANSLQTKTIKTLKSVKSSNYSEQPIEMSLSGDFNGFYNYLLQLEKLPRLTRISQMSLQKISEHDGAMQAQMTLSIFFEPDTKDQTASADPS